MSPGECPLCGRRQSFSEQHDAAFCPVCNIWLEPSCKDPDCSYCRDRPEAPLGEMPLIAGFASKEN